MKMKQNKFVIPALTALISAASGSVWAADVLNLVSSPGDGEVVLAWAEPDSNSTFQIYYDTDSTPAGRVRIASLAPNVLNYTASGLQNGKQYWFWIKYQNSQGQWVNTEAVTTTPSGNYAKSPVALTGKAGNGQVDLHWTDSSAGSNFQVYYDTDSDPKGRTKLTTLRAGTFDYTVHNLNNNSNYWFWVKYTDSKGHTANSNAFQAKPSGNSGPDVDPNATVVDSSQGLLSAVSKAKAGDTIYLRGTTYYFNDSIDLDRSGSASKMITLSKYPSDSTRPLLDFSSMSEKGSNRGIELRGSYWHVYGIDVQKAGDNGMHITGSHNTIEFSTFSRNADTGLQLDSGASYNLIKNVDSYFNADSTLENADGFAAKLGIGTGNRFYGCRAWNNLDDGIDGYLRGADNVTTTYENTWVIRNGYLENGKLGKGDGNGFKTGGSDTKKLKHNAIYINTIAAGNAEDGYDHNSNRGNITIYNSVAYQNGRNISFSTKNIANRLEIKNTISYQGRKSKDKYDASHTNISHNSWQDGHSVSSSDFKSMDINQLLRPRKADGSLPDVDFFHLRSNSDLINAGTDVGVDYKGSAPDIGAFEER
ncbi:right-handed parallel beta-helix repeat-containing protein [Vibrio mangrovi]|uniref:Pectate lyase L n=1 Tax=Vibrio mangrovi TaxID=474394 RepID=A0A1Y6IMY3_9VIBR|nr:right-handed parallel beta-helix repeat-containing protein [Vibrio mangrovi]MDW6004196.1 right-handed parallel beta-helix repeat-containing protein [Vibrio mangrovi]SMR99007.1 Pectate lyase L precursor [Vibrio mangrovi]